MDETLRQLGGILLKAIPTVCLLLIVHVYLRWMFFGPLRKILAKRREATEGARESAEAILAKATSKAAAIEAELRKTLGLNGSPGRQNTNADFEPTNEKDARKVLVAS